MLAELAQLAGLRRTEADAPRGLYSLFKLLLLIPLRLNRTVCTYQHRQTCSSVWSLTPAAVSSGSLCSVQACRSLYSIHVCHFHSASLKPTGSGGLRPCNCGECQALLIPAHLLLWMLLLWLLLRLCRNSHLEKQSPARPPWPIVLPLLSWCTKPLCTSTHNHAHRSTSTPFHSQSAATAAAS